MADKADPPGGPARPADDAGRRGKSPRVRLDKLVVERGLAETRTKAQALILAGAVVVDDHAVDKPGTQVRADAAVRLKKGAGEVMPFVSRGGQKLQGALEDFAGRTPALDVTGRVAMDVGASTGGFTDCLLQAGVARVYAVDVGYGQLAWKLTQDPRVTVLDRQNIRSLQPEQLGEPVSLAVADCSFISLLKVLEALPPLLADGADVVALIKPQFEVGRDGVGKGGIVRDATLRAQARERVIEGARALGFVDRGWCTSPIRGREGNEEFLVWLVWSPGDTDAAELPSPP